MTPVLRMFTLSVVLVAGSLGGCVSFDEEASAPDRADDLGESVEILEVFDTTELNAGLDPDMPTVDLAFYVTEDGPVSWSRMSDAVVGARDIYAQVGMQIRVSSAMLIRVPDDWQHLDPDILDEPTNPEFRLFDLYRHQDDVNRRLAPRTEAMFDAIVANYPAEQTRVPVHRALHIITVDDVPLSFYEWTEDETWELKTVGTSGLSFPPYMFAERMPTHLRGVITMSGSGSKTLAHEMGHNLINISHEGLGVCPAFAQHGPDLMLYGSGTRIPGGLEGRWQQERLQLSPFVYELEGGVPVFEHEFVDGGRYFDPLYGEFMIDPPCEPE